MNSSPERTLFPSALLPRVLLGAALAVGSAVLWQLPSAAAESGLALPRPAVDEPVSTATRETAVLAGGCFWGMQGVFQHVKGVTRVAAGYAGGRASTANYETVSTGATGHAEAVEISFNPQQISYGQLLQIYFSVAHNPTELNRQGPDTGTQYRSAIFPENALQRRVAQRYIAQLNAARLFPQPIVTTTEALPGFYRAENYHQDFLALNPDYPYIAAVDMPLVRNLQRLYPRQYRDKPVLLLAANG